MLLEVNPGLSPSSISSCLHCSIRCKSSSWLSLVIAITSSKEMMSYLLPKDCFYFMPNRITKPILEIRSEREDRKAKSEPKQTAKEKKASEYRCNITRMIYDIESLDTIASIYSFIMGLLSVKKDQLLKVK